MEYEIMLANGNQLIDRVISGVGSLEVIDGAYFIRDRSGDILFSAPFDSVIYINQK